MSRYLNIAMVAIAAILLPGLSHSQGLGDEMDSLHTVLQELYTEMMPLCSRLIGVGQGIAGFAATWYISTRVWRHISNAEPIDFYPLFRPFVIGFAVVMFPTVLGMINGVLEPTVSATGEMVKDSDKAITALLKQKEDAIKKTEAWQMYVGETGSGDRDRWYKYTHPDDPTGDDEGVFESVGNDIKFAMSKAGYNFRNSIKEWMSEVLKVLFEAAALCIDTLRTFNLIVLAIIGPLAFGIGVFDGFGHTLTGWIARYINIFLWLPVANIFGAIIGKIQEKMLELDISQIDNTGDSFFSSTDAAFLVFMIIGIIGYFTVPSVANYIVNAGGGSAITQKVTGMFSNSSRGVINTVSAGASMAAGAAGGLAGRIGTSMNAHDASHPYDFGESGEPKGSGYMSDKIKGES